MQKILILTCEEDPHADSVSNYLSKEGIDFFRVNTDKLINNYKVVFNSRSGSYSITNKIGEKNDEKEFQESGGAAHFRNNRG